MGVGNQTKHLEGQYAFLTPAPSTSLHFEWILFLGSEKEYWEEKQKIYLRELCFPSLTLKKQPSILIPLKDYQIQL